MTVLLLTFVISAGAGAADLVPNSPDLPDAGITTPTPIPETDLKILPPPDEVLNEVPTPEPTPEGGSAGPGPVAEPEPEPEPEPQQSEGASPEENDDPARERDRTSEAPAETVTMPEVAPASRREATTADAVRMGALQSGAIRGVAPGLAVLATRAKELATPLAAPMGLGLVALVLLGLASRGPGVITKLNEELESADGRQVWRF